MSHRFHHRVLTLAVAAGACFGGSLGAQAATTLIYCAEGSPEGFDPARYTAGTTFNASSQPVFNRLVEFEPGGTAVTPGLAEKWSISPDGLVYTFTLRKGVKFHSTDWFKPGREFNADDVVFSFDRMINKDNAFTKASPASFEYADDMGLAENITKIDKPDPMTVRFTLKTVDAAFLANLAMDFASIQSAEYGDQLLKAGTPIEINNKPVGTGPFVFRRYEKDAQIRYTAFESYWRGKAQIDNLIFAITQGFGRALAKAQGRRVPDVGLPETGRSRSAEEGTQHQADGREGFEHRLPVAQRQTQAV